MPRSGKMTVGSSRTALVLCLALVLLAAFTACSPASDVGNERASGEVPTTPRALSSNDPYNLTARPAQTSYQINISEQTVTVAGGSLTRYSYTDAENRTFGAGQPLILDLGVPATITVSNHTDVPTNIHWHGLTVPNDQDGPEIVIAPGETHSYSFTPLEAGTYWYHAHQHPVYDQISNGMYGPLIVRDPSEKSAYDVDQIFVLQDWIVNGSTGGMEAIGDTDTVNGRTADDIAALTLAGGQIARLRFVNASPALTQTLQFPFDVTVTHIDGYPLATPRTVRSLAVVPSGRVDVEVALSGAKDQQYSISNDRDAGLRIPVDYTGNSATNHASLFRPAPEATVSASLLTQARLSGGMGMQNGMGVQGGMGMQGGTGMQDGTGMQGGMTWTINDRAFPDTGTMAVALNTQVKIRFTNSGMHNMAHPMHIHGAHFQVIAVDGQPSNDPTWYDSYPVAFGSTTDIAITFTKPGVWLIHCHILSHEDGGMMASFTVS